MKKTMVLLDWNDKQGRFNKFLLNPAINGKKRGSPPLESVDEQYFVATQYIGYL